MAVTRTVSCSECRTEFDTTSARAKYCSAKCRKAASRRPSKQGAAEVAAKEAESPAYARGGLLGRTISDLTALGVLDTIPGQAAAALAYRIESPMETGAAAASMTKELSRLVEEAKKLAPKSLDGVDQLAESVGAKLLRVVS